MQSHVSQVTAHERSVFDRLPAPGLLLVGIASVQVGAAFATKLFVHLGPAGTVLLRVLFAAVVLCAIWRPRPSSHDASDLRLAAMFGLALALMNLCFYEAIARIPLGVAVTLEFVGPRGVAVVGREHGRTCRGGRKPQRRRRAGVRRASVSGVLFALAAGGLWAAYILLNARIGRAFAGGEGLAIAMAVATVPLIPIGVADAGAELLRPDLLAAAFAVAMLSSVIPYSLELEALRRMRTQLFGVLMSAEPAMAALAGLVIIGQGLSAPDMLGIGLVITACAGATLGSRAPAPIDA